MTHNTFDYFQDVIVHVKNFLKVFTNYSINNIKKDDNDDEKDNDIKGISFPSFMYKYPIRE